VSTPIGPPWPAGDQLGPAARCRGGPLSAAGPGRSRRRGLPRAFYDRPALAVAPELLGKLLVGSDGRSGRIVEVEAYGGHDDPASHAYRGRTDRNATMWGPSGHLYVYFTYGMHWCANAVCGPGPTPGAVLLRAVQPLTGLEAMRAARWRAQHRQVDRDLCRGPGRLCQAYGWNGTDDGTDLAARHRTDGAPGILSDGVCPPDTPQVSTRIGLRRGTDLPWRFSVPGSAWVSGPRPHTTGP
jgi:DNA-3-methyladenine glycosylase